MNVLGVWGEREVGIGDAFLIGARTRPKFVGGSRAVYDETLL